MHSFARHRHSHASKASAKETKGLVLDRGWRYDLMVGFFDTFFFRGKIAGAQAKDRQPGPHTTRRAGAGCGLRHGNAGD